MLNIYYSDNHSIIFESISQNFIDYHFQINSKEIPQIFLPH